MATVTTRASRRSSSALIHSADTDVLVLARRIYVLDAFKKKSKRGSETPKHDIDLVRTRLREAEALDEAAWRRAFLGEDHLLWIGV